ncbi:probable helicase senataxin [Nephila pilipes]|uniref:Probable helicase senataxin n=1 Tax=Nephila pilipes TaxID=299642 RepID=A0A8X6NT76_NEPPI|nr:probable helicase senataxin [Nephila pilipes]
MEYYLRQIESGNPNPLIIELIEPDVIVGRKTHPISIKYIQVSRIHARFKKQNDDWFVEDMGSLNGVFVNGNEISSPVRLEIGDHVGFGVPGIVEDCDGFVCAFAVKKMEKEILFVDLSDDPPPLVVKSEPADDTTWSNGSKDLKNEASINTSESLCNTNRRKNIVTHTESVQSVNNSNNERNVSILNISASNSSIVDNLQNSNVTDEIASPKDTVEQFSSKLITSNSPASSSITSTHFIKSRSDQINSGDILKNSNFSIEESSNMENNPRNFKKPQHTIQNYYENEKQNSILTKKDHSASTKNVNQSNLIRDKLNGQSSFKTQQKEPNTNRRNQNCKVNSNETILPLREQIKAQQCRVYVKRCDHEDFKLPPDVKWSYKINQNPGMDEQCKSKKKRLSLSTENNQDTPKHQCHIKTKESSSIYQNKISVTNTFNSVKLLGSHLNKPVDLDPEVSPMILNEQTNVGNINTVKNEDEQDMNYGYSQTEEIVIISDDEAYFDFNSSQLRIKEEPPDYDEMEIDFEPDIKIPGNDNASNLSMSSEDSESIDKIKKFLKSSEAENLLEGSQAFKQDIEIGDYFPMSQLNNDSNDDNNLGLPNNTIPLIEDKIFGTSTSRDILGISSSKHKKSDDSNSDSSVSSHSSVIIPSQSKKVGIEQFRDDGKNKSLSKAKGRTMLIEAQKMHRRPKKIRGREEWFDDKAAEDIPEVSIPIPKKSKKKVKLPQTSDSPKKKNKVLSTRQSLLNKLENLPKKNKVSTRQSLLNKLENSKQNIKSTTGGQTAKKRECKTSVAVLHENVASKFEVTKEYTPKKKNPPISRYPTTAASRSGFLTEPHVIRPGSAKKRNLSIRNYSIPKIDSYKKNLKNYNVPIQSTSSSIAKNTVVNSSVPQHKTISQPVNVKFDNAHQSKRIFTDSKTGKPAASIGPFSTTSLPANNKDFHMLTTGYVGHISNRDPRLHQRLNLVNNNAHNLENNVSVVNVWDLDQNKVNSTNINNNKSQVNNINSNNITPFFQMHNNNMNTVNNLQLSMTRNSSFSNALHPVMQSSLRPNVSASHQKSMSEINQHNSLQISYISTIKLIVELNVKWLEEQGRVDKPPPIIAKYATNLPLYFDSSNHYILSFFPMLLLEVWDLMYQESKPIFENPNRVVNKFYFIIVSCDSRYDMTVYNCEAMVNKQSFSPSEGSLLIMEIVSTETKRCVLCFGYVFRSQVDDNKNPISEKWKKIAPAWLDDAKLWQFSVFSKTRSISPILHKIMKGNGICGIRNKIRLVDSLKSIQSSPLCKLIVQPNYDNFHVSYSNVYPNREYSYSQKMAIEGISAEMLKMDSKPKIVMVQGPPGTGKTHTIVGLLEKLLKSNAHFKILVTAPSNAAVDEIGCRLKELNYRESYKSTQMKFVRIGIPDHIKESLKSHTLDEKAAKMFREHCKLMKDKENMLEKIQKDIDALKKNKSDSKIQQKIKDLSDEQNRLRKLVTQHTSDYVLENNFKTSILRDTSIVLSTLGSSRHSILASVFKRNSTNAFSLCIIDEATQCTETEALIPLMFGINKLIMVGDHQQLPATVNSKYAVSFGFERSMFERFHLYFSKYCSNNPIFMLREQFRMHSEISLFPSKHFYENLLTTAPQIDIQYESFPIYPYVVYDILDSQESSSFSSKTNSNEALVIVNICSELLRLDSHISIGIITPYQAQCTLYTKSLKHNPNYRHIEVNTVDSFQGREKDIIIVSCVRANSPNGTIGFLSCKKRLNVAITRARKCLIICVHSSTLMQDENWKKLIEDAKERHFFKTVASYKDIQQIFDSTMVKRRSRH